MRKLGLKFFLCVFLIDSGCLNGLKVDKIQNNEEKKIKVDFFLNKRISKHITTVSIVSAFIIVSTWKPKNACKWVKIGPKPIAVVFKSLLF